MKESIIKNKRVECSHLAVKDQLKLLKFLSVTIGGGIKGLERISDVDFDSNMVKTGASVVGSFVDNLKDLDDDLAIFWIEKILDKTRVDGKIVKLESDFNGDISFLFDVVQLGLEANFSDFLEEKLGRIKEIFGDILKEKLNES